MGWKDKLEQAKQQGKALADQAQAKLDEAQKQFNDSQAANGAPTAPPSGGYDKHGRPLQSSPPPDAPPPAAAPGDEAAPAVAPEPDLPPPVPTPPVTETQPPAGTGDVEAERRDQYAPPGLTSGDPLAG